MALAEDPPFNRLITYYSSWSKLVRAIAWMKRFQLFLLKKLAKKTLLDPESGFLSVEELQQATMYVIRYVQDDVLKAVKAKLTYFEEYPCLSRVRSNFGKCCPSSLRKVRPIMVQGVLRVGGHLQHSRLSVDQRHPAILPARHHVTGLIVKFYHVQQGHCGTQSMLSATREKFWIVKGISSVRHYLKECKQCRCCKQQACKQLMAPLPKCCVTSGMPAFTFTGVDYFGPILVKVKRSHAKRYGCIFTWMATRAVHLEVACSLDANSFPQAFFRFIHRRGGISEIFSDNGTNFVMAERERRAGIKRWNQQLVHKSLSQKGLMAFQPSAFPKQWRCLGNFGEISEENLEVSNKRKNSH